MSDNKNCSLVWDYFTICETDESKAKCISCDKIISRGGKDRNNWGHKGLRNHLATHINQNSDFKRRLFSSSGLICSDRRTRLSPENLEILVYLSKNLPAVDYEY